jgi:hypothetical protein
MTTELSLTEREREVLDHLQKAQELGSTLVEYATAFNQDVKELYAVKQQLVRKGALAGRAKVEEPQKLGTFAPVRIVPSVSPPASSAVAFRLVHPSGWTIECASLPEANWIAALMKGAKHAAA